MGDSDMSKNIRDFIVEEARDQALELSIMGIKEFEKQKRKYLNQGKKKVDTQHEAQVRKLNIDWRISKSSRINGSRHLIMDARHQLTEKIKGDIQQHILHIVQNDKEYSNMLKALIVQGMIKMSEPVVIIKCRKQDAQQVQRVIPACYQMLADIYKSQEISHFPKTELKVDHNDYLPGEGDADVLGGVELTSESGTIVCKNTLDARLQHSYIDSLPDTRSMLWPQASAR